MNNKFREVYPLFHMNSSHALSKWFCTRQYL